MDSDMAGNDEYENATGSGPSSWGAVRGEPWTASGGGAPDGLLLVRLPVPTLKNAKESLFGASR